MVDPEVGIGEIARQEAQAMEKTKQLRVVVHYAAAGEPFKDDDADRGETVGHLKGRALDFFEEVEEQTPDGNIISFTLYNGKTALENLAQTLGEVAGEKPVLQLKLARQVTQGA